MMWLLVFATVLSLGSAQPRASDRSLDVSKLQIGPLNVVTELDLGKLKGEPREICWSPDQSEMYVQVADGAPPAEKLHHYLVTVSTGAMKPIDGKPAWAREYWLLKADRSAPGVDSLTIQAVQTTETQKSGTGPAGALDREASPIGGNLGNAESIAKGTDQYQKASVWRLTLLGETVSEFVNERPVPGLMFAWGPEHSGAIAFIQRDAGRVMLLDQQKHKQTVPGAKDAILPAWSPDGARLAWLQKSGRKKFALTTATLVLR